MKNQKVYKVLEAVGILVFILSGIFFFCDLFSLLVVEIIALIGLILCIPNNIIFIKYMLSKDEKISVFWKYKFLAIPICICGFLFAIIMELSK